MAHIISERSRVHLGAAMIRNRRLQSSALPHAPIQNDEDTSFADAAGHKSSELAMADMHTARRFTESFGVSVNVLIGLVVLCTLQSASAGFEDWPMLLGAVIFMLISTTIRRRLHRMANQRRACMIFSWVFACLACVFVAE